MKIRLLFLFTFYLITFNLQSQSTASAQVSGFQIEAPQLDTLKKIWIYLPKTYKTSKKRYPVIYMHDAQNLFDRETSFVGEWEIDETLDSLEIPEAIIVGIEHGGEKRLDELTPFPNEKYGGGKGDSYLEFLTQNLKPHIDSTYRTKADIQNTGIFGSSLGGLISFYALLKYPETFGMAGIYSPSFWFTEKIYEYAREKKLNTNARISFLVGTEESEEMIPDMKRMIELLTARGMKAENFQAVYVEGGKHNEALWRQNFAKTYLWLINNKSLE
ncbi:alpha/beta hydrolase-fold protein [Gramella sp. GC03-9]|uniref:Alpha/beta hydrolase-fold protein n=1 Tax=Christiangramia oceanisediminis TaxID=2920386 RepID=A0A9X2R9U1_9FLAO|nr:alpha/beta hydrolase-fold protein [Gramella oceanisediminis]MCP9201008.1 alpha/beta hydrolase-fold protein [Gramella oceanisediminis]